MIQNEIETMAVYAKDYKVQARSGYKFINLPKATETGKIFEAWVFPDGRILLKPKKESDVK